MIFSNSKYIQKGDIMNEILQSVLDDNFVVFNEKFKDALKTDYDIDVDEIKSEVNKSMFEVAMVSDKICKNCGKELPISIQGAGSCPFCGELV